MISGRTLDLSIGHHHVPTSCDVVGEGPHALLLPALSSVSTRAEMRPLARELARDHLCLVPDWPGFGAQDRVRLPLDPRTLHGFLDALLAVEPGPYALAVGAGHAAAYLVAAASRHPSVFERLVLVAPTWRGPLPTAMGAERAAWFPRIRRAVELPVFGELLYRLNITRPVIGRMIRAHVYAEARHVTSDLVEAKHAVTRARGGRFGTAAFVTGGLDPVPSRDAFIGLFADGLPPVHVLRPMRAPRRSGAEMDALVESGRVSSASIPGALGAHEEFFRETAAAIRSL